MLSLPDLPTELLLEIVKYYPEQLSSLDASVHGTHSDQFDGNDTLRALSQTCRTLRDVFLPVLWAHVHAYFTVRNLPKRKIKTRAKMLEHRMRGIQRTSLVIPYIHSLSITLEECNHDNWQPLSQFIRVLDLLPNLQSLTILRIPTEMIAVCQTSFREKLYPSITALALPDELAGILHCFPNVQELTRGSDGYTDKLFNASKDIYKHVRTVNNVSANVVKALRQAIPHVQRLSIWKPIGLDTLRLLEGMDNLSDLRIRYRNAVYEPTPPLDELIAAAERVLRTSKARGRKELRIQHLEQYDGIIRDETLFLVGRP